MSPEEAPLHPALEREEQTACRRLVGASEAEAEELLAGVTQRVGTLRLPFVEDSDIRVATLFWATWQGR